VYIPVVNGSFAPWARTIRPAGTKILSRCPRGHVTWSGHSGHDIRGVHLTYVWNTGLQLHTASKCISCPRCSIYGKSQVWISARGLAVMSYFFCPGRFQFSTLKQAWQFPSQFAIHCHPAICRYAFGPRRYIHRSNLNVCIGECVLNKQIVLIAWTHLVILTSI
jgi:hypothetical protein